MGTFNIRIDDKLKKEAYEAFDELDLTPTEGVRLLFQYVATNKKFPIKSVLMDETDSALLEEVKNRLNNPSKRIKVNLNDL